MFFLILFHFLLYQSNGAQFSFPVSKSLRLYSIPSHSVLQFSCLWSLLLFLFSSVAVNMMNALPLSLWMWHILCLHHLYFSNILSGISKINPHIFMMDNIYIISYVYICQRMQRYICWLISLFGIEMIVFIPEYRLII